MTDGTQVSAEALDAVYALCRAPDEPHDVFQQRLHEDEATLEPLRLSVDDVLVELGQRALAANAKAKRLQRDASSSLSVPISNQSTPQPRPENFGVQPPSQPPSQRASPANTPAVRTREHSVVELSSDEDEEERRAWDRQQARKCGFLQGVRLHCAWSASQINACLRKQDEKRRRARNKREKFAIPAVPTASTRADRAARDVAPIAPTGPRSSLMLCLECQNELDPWAKRGRCAKCNEKHGIRENIEEIGRTHVSRRCAVCKTVCLNMDERGVCFGCLQVNGGHEEAAIVDVPPQDVAPTNEIDVVALDDSDDEAAEAAEAEAEVMEDDEPVEVPRGSSSQSNGKRASVSHKRKHRSSSPAPARRPRGRPPKSARSGSGQLQEYLDYCLECLTPAAACSKPFLMNRCAGCFEKLRDQENATAKQQGAAAGGDTPFAHSHDGRTAAESVAAEVLGEIVRQVADAQAEAPVAVDATGAAPVEVDGAGAPPLDANAQSDAQVSQSEAEAQGPREYAPHEPDDYHMDDEGQRHVIIVK
ncbi:hypothetical protein M3Y99_01340100 [Aphelenchoides fujianensis]|nr:hypothetical protein M3Y99_01340100 [Aphelenchoides fujianensis]